MARVDMSTDTRTGGGLRGRILASTALGCLTVMMASPALANSLNGGPAPAYTIKAQSPNGTIDILVDSEDVTGPGSVGLSPIITLTSRLETAAIEVFNPGTTNITVRFFGRSVGASNSYSGIWVNRATKCQHARPPAAGHRGHHQ
jgi:hypothetical protein